MIATVIFGVLLALCNNVLAPGYKPGMLSLELAFTSERAMAMLTTWGDSGRRLFLQSIVLDFFFPLAYGSWLSGLLTQATANGSRAGFLPLLPLIAAVCDVLENLSQIVTVSHYPAFGLFSVTATAGFASVKFLLLLVSVIGLWWCKRGERCR
jgi:hypothetical protein